MKQRYFYAALCIIAILGSVLRLYKFNAPIADWHSWRQADTAAVARNFSVFGFDPLRPRYDDVSNIQSRKENPQGYRMVEFPVYQITAYTIFRIFPFLTIEKALRLVSIGASVITLFIIGFVGHRLGGKSAGLWSAFVYAILPYSVFYGRSILPEPIMIAFSFLAVFLLLLAKDNKNMKTVVFCILLSAVFSSLSLLSKPYAVFLLIPAGLLYVQILKAQKNSRLSVLIIGLSFVYAFIAGLPLYLWRQWILQYPEGIPSSSWLFNEGNIRFKGAWFYWLFAERISKLIFGYWGAAFVVYGLLVKIVKKEGLLIAWGVGLLAYIVVIARGNVQHDYYQQLLVPYLSLLSGLGIAGILSQQTLFSSIKRSLLICCIFAFTIAFSWYDIRGFFWINRPEIIEAGNTADVLLPKNAKVIAPYNGDTTFLYQTKRQGWPIGFDIYTKISQGATHYVTVSPNDSDSETASLSAEFNVLVKNDRFAIIDLTQKK